MARKRYNKKTKVTQPSTPVTAEGSLDWSRVAIPRVAQDKQTRTLPQAVFADQETPALAVMLIAVSFFGIVFSTRWAPLLLAALVLASLLERRMRDNNWMLAQALLASALCLLSWPLINNIVVSTNTSVTAAVIIALMSFVGALWLVGNITRAASLLYNQFSLRCGLYAVGVACQSLAVLVMLLGAVQLGVYALSL